MGEPKFEEQVVPTPPAEQGPASPESEVRLEISRTDADFLAEALNRGAARLEEELEEVGSGWRGTPSNYPDLLREMIRVASETRSKIKADDISLFTKYKK